MEMLSATLRLQWQDVLDLAVLALATYAVLLWARKARAVRIALVIVCLHVAAVSTSHVGLAMTAWVLHGASLIAVVMLFVLFQPEVRHGVILLISALPRAGGANAALAGAHEAISDAAFALAEKRLGALIAVARSGPFSEGVAHGGVTLGANVSSQLLQSVFSGDSPLHDGAVVVEGDRITRAGVLLPVSSRPDIPGHFGTRHRAAVGLVECCDALAVAVSEERGEVRLFHKRGIWPMESASALFHRLQKLQERASDRSPVRIWQAAFADPGLALAALVLASLVWLVRLLEAGGG
jgi:uncharacterized protein (TIGR00159 family)